jgi:hypothetical protein
METARAMHEWRSVADEIWAMLRETARRQEETAQAMKETDRRMQETARRQEETDRQMKETDKRLGRLTNRFGEVVEYMIMPGLVEKFQELGYDFEKATRDLQIIDRKHDIILEVDAFLENGDKAMAVEIKSKPDTRDVNEHIERMGKLRRYADLKNDRRIYLGALAGVVINESVKTYALKSGFYMIEPSGDTFNIIAPQGAYHPREW